MKIQTTVIYFQYYRGGCYLGSTATVIGLIPISFQLLSKKKKDEVMIKLT